jgi:hypothetical protein
LATPKAISTMSRKSSSGEWLATGTAPAPDGLTQ